MIRTWLRLEQDRRRPVLLPMLAVLALAIWMPVALTMVGWPSAGDAAPVRAERYMIPLAPLSLASPASGWLGHPINFGYRCTLVDAAAVLEYYGAHQPQTMLALLLSDATDYSARQHGPPWWAYIAPPGDPTLLDRAIEQVAGESGIQVASQTTIGLSFERAIAAIAQDHPVILNVVRAPDGTYNHSLLAYGYDTRGGKALLLVLDPNSQASYWVGPGSYWSSTLTATFITPAESSRVV
jgi:hypothetical protein